MAGDIARCLADNLLVARGRAGLTQEEVSFRAAIHRTEISQLERGLRVPRVDTLVKLAGALGIPPQQLLQGIEWSPPKRSQGSFAIEP
jgi:transcriptional regulator with XRE-family HTH domain